MMRRIQAQGSREFVPVTAISRKAFSLRRRESEVRSSTSMWSVGLWLRCAVCAIAIEALMSAPATRPDASESKFFDSLPKGIANEEDHASPAYTIRFVPLATLLASYFPNFLARLGQFTGVTTRTPPTQANVAAEDGDVEDDSAADEDESENELIECDGSHLGLWPDRSDSQRYYKCEIDPRTPSTASCIKDVFRGKGFDNADLVPLERIRVPGVKPCFLLSMLNCSNGFRYHHKTRICVPDIVFASRTRLPQTR